MAQSWPPKAPTEIVQRRWTVPLAECDSISAVSTTASGVTVDSDDHQLDDAIIVISGGTDEDVGSVVVTVTTTDGNRHVETFLIAIRASAQAFAYTVRDVCKFALRKVVGNGVDADATEADDALERFNDMVALWRIDGLDIGIPGPLALGGILEIPDEYIMALKFNLRVSCHDHYDAAITAFDASMAESTKRLIANRLLDMGDLSFSTTLSSRATAALAL